MNKFGLLYKWQKVIIWIIGILTFIGSALKNIGKGFNIGSLISAVVGVGINILILWLLFKAGNWVYQSIKRAKMK
ncbi:MAG: hypothetical protein IMZ60_04265 [Actinobacteria bacterium]|nr:hypothetical protein [Actinomycetota bacterium]